MFALVKLQLATIFLLTLLCWLIWGAQYAVSLLLGGLSYFLPTIIAVLILNLFKAYPVMAGIGFIVSEGLKIVLALAIMVLVVLSYQELNFIPYLIGLLSASHFVFLFFLKVHRYGK